MRVERLFIGATAVGIAASGLMAYYTTPLAGLVTYCTFTFELLLIMLVLYIRGWLE